MSGVLQRILIWAKTYPKLSNRHRETVCTGGSTEDGLPVRIYPVPMRYLPELHRYRLYDWIEAPLAPSNKDARPESYKITDPRKIKIISHVDSKRGWLKRRELIFQNRSWHFECVQDLKLAQKRAKVSMGLVRVGKVEWVKLVKKGEPARNEHNEKLKELLARNSFLSGGLEAQRNLEFLPFSVRIGWKCSRLLGPEACSGHSATIMDWGLGELGRREGAQKALAKAKEITDLGRNDLYFFMGNLKARPHVFGIVGMFYPNRAAVQEYPLHPGLWDSSESAVLPRAPGDGPQIPLL